MKIALAVMGVILTLWMLYAFRKPLRKSVIPALVWLANKLGALPVKASLWCWKRRWALVAKSALSFLLAVAVGVPVVLLFPDYFGIGKLADIHVIARLAVALAWVGPCWMIGEPQQINGIAFLGIFWRGMGTGTYFPFRYFIFRPFGLPIERVFKTVQEENFSKSFKMDIEVQKGNDLDVLPVEVTYLGGIRAQNLPNWTRFSPEQRHEAIQKWISSIMTFVSHDMAKTMSEVYSKKSEIEAEVLRRFVSEAANGYTLPEYFGNDIHKIGFANVDVPADLKAAVNEKKKQEELRAARKVDAKSVQERVGKLVKIGVDPSEAVKAVDIRDGKRTAVINENKISFGAVIDTAIGSAVATIAEKFAGKKSKGSYRKKL